MIAAFARSIEDASPVPLWASAPFVALLFAIALFPLFAKRWWRRHYASVSLSLGAAAVAYVLFLRSGPSASGERMLFHVLVEYLSFVALIGSLFVVSSGVLVRIHAPGSTTVNVALLGMGGLLANLVGTTGAAMLLIRPYLRVNRAHFGSHHLPFFIFIVANCGGALTPIGDPPLFLGYLRGVPFFWTAEHAAMQWAVTLGLLLLAFAVFDRMHARRSPRRPPSSDRMGIEISGLKSLFFLVAITGLVLLQNQPIVKEHAPVSTLILSITMLGVSAGAYVTADRRALRENEFTFEPIREVAVLFAGIFATMIPTLLYLEANARLMNVGSPARLYFATGALSAFVDNAPTYLTFLTTQMGLLGLDARNPDDVQAALAMPDGALGIAAISCGSVFFGAMTYIGNGPNFMVKSIAESAGFRCPSFVGYIGRWSVPVLLPILALVAVLFFGAAT